MTGGVRGEWRRAHRTPRRALFTPHRVAGGPGRDAIMITKRTTKGTYVGTGEEFTIVDDYADPNCAHRIMPHAWIGTTLIHEEMTANSDDEVAHDKSLPLDSIRVKSLLCLSERRGAGCGIPRRRVQKSARPRYLGGVGRINGSVRQAAGVSRSEALAGPPPAPVSHPTQKSRNNTRLLVPIFRPRPVHELSSEALGRGRGGVQGRHTQSGESRHIRHVNTHKDSWADRPCCGEMLRQMLSRAESDVRGHLAQATNAIASAKVSPPLSRVRGARI